MPSETALRQRKASRVIPILVVVGVAATALVGCSAAPQQADCTPLASGTASDSVEVSGDFGGDVTWAFDSAISADATQRTVVTEGDGDLLVEDGTTANLTYSMFNGTTGELLESSSQISDEPIPFAYETGTSMPGLEKVLDCATAGSRIVGVIVPSDAFGDSGLPEAGIEPGDTIVLVADVQSVEDTPEATPTPVPSVELPTPSEWTDGIPELDMSTEVPTITIPDSAPDPMLRLKVLEQGDGAEVPNGSTITVDYVGISWEDKTVFDESYSTGQPLRIGTDTLIKGFSAAVVGQKVGSTVLVTIPPDLGYGAEASQTNALAGKTLVFLIQILAAE